MRIIKYPITFEYQGKTHRWVISYEETIHLPTTFHVNDENNYFAGQLLYYASEDRWRFFYKNQDNVQELADILAEFVVKGYQ